jgi:hypothetical protein
VSPFPPFLFSQPRCFPQTIDFYRPCFHILTNPFSCNPFIFTSIQNPRGVRGPCAQSRHSFTQSVYYEGPLVYPERSRGATRYFPFVLSSLPPLGLSWLSFSHSLPLFSAACGLFLQNAGGWGIASRMPLRDTRGGVGLTKTTPWNSFHIHAKP